MRTRRFRRRQILLMLLRGFSALRLLVLIRRATVLRCAVQKLRPLLSSAPFATMPPRAAASRRGPKRKVETTSPEPKPAAAEPEAEAAQESEAEEDEDGKPKKAKRAKKVKEPVKPIDPAVPTNLTIPDDLAPFPRPAEGCVRISAWNVAGLRACEKKGACPAMSCSSPPVPCRCRHGESFARRVHKRPC